MEGPPVGAGPVDVGDGLFTYRQLLTLPPGGMAALALIDQAWTALRRRYGRMLLRWHSPGAKVIAADLAPIPEQARALQELPVIAHLDAGPIPVRVRLALLGAATALPGAILAARAHAVTVSRPPLTRSQSALPLTLKPANW